MRGIFREREIWYHGTDGFYNIDYVDRPSQTVHGLQLYRLAGVDDGFHLRSVIDIPSAKWRDDHWVFSEDSVDTRSRRRRPHQPRDRSRCDPSPRIDQRLPRGTAGTGRAQLPQTIGAHHRLDQQGNRRVALPRRPLPQARSCRLPMRCSPSSRSRSPSPVACDATQASLRSSPLGYTLRGRLPLLGNRLGLATSLGQTRAPYHRWFAAWSANGIYTATSSARNRPIPLQRMSLGTVARGDR